MPKRPITSTSYRDCSTNRRRSIGMRAPILIRLVAWVLVFGASCVSAAVAEAFDSTSTKLPANAFELNLRLVWGGEKPLHYVGTVEVTDAQVAGLQQLGIDPFDPGFLKQKRNGVFAINDLKTRFGGCDLHVVGKATGTVVVNLQITDPETNAVVSRDLSWSLQDLKDNPITEVIEGVGCRVSIDRVPGDRLRVVTNRSHLIYNSHEPLGLQIQPYGLPWPAQQMSVETKLVRLDSENTTTVESRVLTLNESGNAEPYPITLSAPTDEGVYELQLKAEPKRTLSNWLGRQAPVLRTVQFVVYNAAANTPKITRQNDSANASANQDGSWQPLVNLIPTLFETESLTHRMLAGVDSDKRMVLMDLARSLARGSKDQQPRRALSNRESGLAIAPHSVSTTLIKGLEPGQMHRITLRAESADLACRVVLGPAEHDGSRADHRNATSARNLMVNEILEPTPESMVQGIVDPLASSGSKWFEILFWPMVPNAKLEIHNLRSAETMHVTDVGIELWDSNIKPDGHTPGKLASPATGSSTLELHSANLRSAFGFQPRKPAGASANDYDDWRQFLNAAELTSKYCNANGFDSVSIVVASQGGSLFPSTKWSANRRFDTGTFSVHGRDPLRKDIVELLYRVTARYGITFVPMFELDGPLTDIEIVSSNTDESDIWQRRIPSETGVDEPTSERQNNLYNPLSYRVQRAIAGAIDEFDSRYKSQPAYQGYALRVADGSHLLVNQPLEQTNSAILDRFVLENSGNVPRETVLRDQFIAQHMLAQYKTWLERSMLDYLGKLRIRPRWVSVENEIDTTSATEDLVFVVPVHANDEIVSGTHFNGTILRNWSVEKPSKIHIAMDRPAHRLDSAFRRLISLTDPFQSTSTYSLTHQDGARSLSRVRVWVSDESNQSIMIANMGATEERIRIAWEMTPSQYAVASTLPTDMFSADRYIQNYAASSEWEVVVPPCEVFRIDLMEEYQPTHARTERSRPLYWYSKDSSMVRSLDSALTALEQGVNRLSIPQRFADFPINSSFEIANDFQRRGRFEGWTTSTDPTATVAIDKRTSTDGEASLCIQNEKATSIAWLQSDPFAMPLSDRLVVSFKVWAEQKPEQVNVSIWLFDYQSDRFEPLATRTLAEAISGGKNVGGWIHVTSDVSDEIVSQMQRRNRMEGEPVLLRLQFEAKGQGTLWLDDISLSSDFLRDTERRDLRSELFLARSSIQNGDIGPAIQLLCSPKGRLVGWGDAAVQGRKQFVSLNEPDTKVASVENGIEPAESKSPTIDKSEKKSKPAKRARGFWWQR